jgi:hypothetical protein
MGTHERALAKGRSDALLLLSRYGVHIGYLAKIGGACKSFFHKYHMRAKEYINTPDLGCWIDPDGNVHSCDHREEIHHADIALDHFDVEPNDDGEYDDYSRDDAIETAMDENWLRISAIDTMGFSINWRGSLTQAQISAASSILSKAKRYPFDRYYLENTETGYQSFETHRELVNAFRKAVSIRNP